MAKNSTTQHTDVLLRTQNLQSNDHVKVFQSLLEKGYLTSWSIGTNHGYISSTFQTIDGTEDTLTSPDENDLDYPKPHPSALMASFPNLRKRKMSCFKIIRYLNS